MKVTIERGGDSVNVEVAAGATVQSLITAAHLSPLTEARTTLNGQTCDSTSTQLRNGDVLAQFPKSGKQGRSDCTNAV